MPKRIYYSYHEFREDVKLLIQQIDQSFDAIVAIARGGMSLAHMLGEYYDLRSVYTINTIGYDDRDKRERVELFNMPQLDGLTSVLVVDDIVDSGDTLIEVLAHLQARYPQIEYKTASLFYKKSAKIAPTWYAKEADAWIDFFWSVDLKGKR